MTSFSEINMISYMWAHDQVKQKIIEWYLTQYSQLTVLPTVTTCCLLTKAPPQREF